MSPEKEQPKTFDDFVEFLKNNPDVSKIIPPYVVDNDPNQQFALIVLKPGKSLSGIIQSTIWTYEELEKVGLLTGKTAVQKDKEPSYLFKISSPSP